MIEQDIQKYLEDMTERGDEQAKQLLKQWLEEEENNNA